MYKRQVAGYQAWQKKFNRHVKRGEKGIQIIAPAPIREKQEIEKIDPVTKEPVIGDDGQPETEIVEMVISRFRVTTVDVYKRQYQYSRRKDGRQIALARRAGDSGDGGDSDIGIDVYKRQVGN